MTKLLLISLLLTTLACEGTDIEGGDTDSGASASQCSASNAVLVSTTKAEALKFCVGYTMGRVGTDEATCVQSLVGGYHVSEAMAKLECTTSMTEAQCLDYEHQFVGSSGLKHGYWFSRKGDQLVVSGFGLWGPAQPQYCAPASEITRYYCNGTTDTSTVFFTGKC